MDHVARLAIHKEANVCPCWRFRIGCPSCAHVNDAPGIFLGRKVRCLKCQHNFIAEWGEPVSTKAV